jgi:hypothetical protein
MHVRVEVEGGRGGGGGFDDDEGEDDDDAEMKDLQPLPCMTTQWTKCCTIRATTR